MTEASVRFTGNLTDDPELRYTDSGIARAMFRVAVSGRREQEPSFFTVVVRRDQADHAQSLSRGSRVVVLGRLQQRSWTAEPEQLCQRSTWFRICPGRLTSSGLPDKEPDLTSGRPGSQEGEPCGKSL